MLKRFLDDRSGATSVEYGLIATFIFLVIVTSLTSIGTNLTPIFNTVSTTLK